MIAGLVLGLWLRWSAVPIVAVGWAGVIAFGHPSSWLGGALLGAVNGAVGLAFALVLRRVLDVSMRQRRNQPSGRR
jgi:hypothetical protein